MGRFLFSNFHFQMGVTVMGFAEDSGLNHLPYTYSHIKDIRFKIPNVDLLVLDLE